jgi:hypothetical protein
MTKQMKLRRVAIEIAWWEDYEGFDLTQEQIMRKVSAGLRSENPSTNGPIVGWVADDTREHEVSE